MRLLPSFDIRRLRLRPGDVIVLHCSEQLSDHNVQAMRQGAERVFPGHPVVILQPGVRLEVTDPP